MKSGVCLISETGEADCVTIDAEELSRVMYCNDLDETTTIEGFLLSNGFMNSGGGVFCSSSSPTFRSCTFADNSGGGDQWSPVEGGGMHCEGSSPVLVSCVFSNNRVVGAGGGLNCVAGSSPTLMDCLFSDNFARGHDDGGGAGGGVYCSDSSPTLTGCTFTGNEATGGDYYPGTGGGMYCDGSTPLLTNCTFSGNAAWDGWDEDGHGGGMYCSGSSLTLINTIIAFSTDGEAVYCDDTSSATLTCCDIFGNGGGDWVGCIADQYGVDGNILVDPRFCDAAQGDFTIAENSPCAPENNPECGLIGALSVGCGVVVVLAGQIAVSDTLLAFGQVCIGWPVSEPLLVSNNGTGWLIVSEISADHPDFSADPTDMAMPPGDSRSVQVEFTPSSAGPITG
ncbi:MAG: right-handed parallel beta-helix repeat-containing protein, partial [Candidatus Eisenbacteria sp.]|nr:right-handed parallel beta-helix repeat-containing protein [Candidatus Eisenbacteria bacterium]